MMKSNLFMMCPMFSACYWMSPPLSRLFWEVWRMPHRMAVGCVTNELVVQDDSSFLSSLPTSRLEWLPVQQEAEDGKRHLLVLEVRDEVFSACYLMSFSVQAVLRGLKSATSHGWRMCEEWAGSLYRMTQRSRHSLLPDSSDCQSDKEEDGKRHLLVLEERWICLGGISILVAKHCHG